MLGSAHPRHRAVRAAAVAVLAAATAAATAANAAGARARAGALATVRLDALRVTAGLTPLHRLDRHRLLHVTVALHPRDDAAEQRLFDALYAGRSPLAGDHRSAYPSPMPPLPARPLSPARFLSPEQFRATFAPDPARLAAVRTFLTRAGLHVDAVAGADDVWVLSGAARAVEATFGVRLEVFRRAGRAFFAPDRAPRLPAALGIDSVVGLDDWWRFRLPTAQTDCVDPGGCVGLLTARDLLAVYDAPAAVTGRGEALGVLGEGDSAGPVADLREYEALGRLPAVPVRVVHTDGARGSYADTSGRAEWALDTEAATAMAPSVRQLVMYMGGSLFNVSLLDDIAAWVGDRAGPRQASMSITECEDTPLGAQTGGFTATPDFVVPADRLLRQAAIEGRTLFAASGDLGSSCAIDPVMPVNPNGVLNEGAPVVAYPAASPYVVAVGGTVLDSSGGARPHRVLETGWTGSGGGQSVSSPQPPWQRTAAPPGLGARPCLQHPDGSPADPAQPCRLVPDVAALSGDVATNGLAIVANGAPNVGGSGTSLSAPLWAGIWARVQSAGSRGGFGFAAPALYRAAAPTAAASAAAVTGPGGTWVDIGAGAASPPTANGAYLTGPGYDYVTGLGVPDIARLVAALRAGTR